MALLKNFFNTLDITINKPKTALGSYNYDTKLSEVNPEIAFTGNMKGLQL